VSKLNHELTLPGHPDAVYAALMDSARHAAFTGAPADIGDGAGAAFSAYGGKVHGVNIELVPGSRIVQAWRSADWPAGTFSLIRFDLEAVGSKTRLRFEHDAMPEGAAAHLDGGWKQMYWSKLEAYLG